MRALNLSPVLATGCSLLWVVRVEGTSHEGSPVQSQGPVAIAVSPTPLVANESYTVTWNDGSSACFIAGVNLVEIGGFDTYAVRSTTCMPDTGASPCILILDSTIAAATATAPPTLDPSKTYAIDILWGTTTTLDAASVSHAFEVLSISVLGGPQPSVSVSLQSTSPVGGSFSQLTASGHSLSTASAATSTGTINKITVSTSTPTAPSSTTSTTAGPAIVNSGSSGLSTGAKVGIAIGAAGFPLLILIVALLMWRRTRQRQLRALPDGTPYSHDFGSTHRDLTAEKEMNVISSPVDTMHTQYSNIPPVTQTQSQSQTGSWALPNTAAGEAGAGTAASYTDAHRGSYGSGYEDSAPPLEASQAHIAPAAAGAGAIPRKPISGPTHHLREPGMSDDEVARLEEEERRLDEAIAEAERRRQLHG